MHADDGDLDIDANLPDAPRPATALARARAVSLALSDAARRARISARRTRRLSSGGFENRTGAKFVRFLLLGSFIAVCAVPTLLAAVYYSTIAADQYIASAEFTVSAGESPMRDGVDSLTGVPLALIVQDTQIIMNFLHSREIVDKLEARIGLRKLYASDNADFLTRFRTDSPVERLVKYWSKVAAVSVMPRGGLVKLNVRAFSPQDATRIAEATVALCDDLVNDLNTRINRDALALAEASMNRATERLAKTLAAQEAARNASGVLEANISAQAITGLVSELKSSLLKMSGAYATQSQYMDEKTPQMRELNARIGVLKQQIVKLEGEMTTTGDASVDPADTTVAAAMSQLGRLDVEQKADEQLYANAATALEHARIASEYRMIYLKVYAPPTPPQESEYPQRGLNMLLVALESLALWGALVAVGAAVRNNMA